MRRFQARGAISGQRGAAALADLADRDVARYEHEPLLAAVWRLRSNLTAYDAVYVALAEALGATLLTLDAGLAAAARQGRLGRPRQVSRAARGSTRSGGRPAI